MALTVGHISDRHCTQLRTSPSVEGLGSDTYSLTPSRSRSPPLLSSSQLRISMFGTTLFVEREKGKVEEGEGRIGMAEVGISAFTLATRLISAAYVQSVPSGYCF